MQHHRVYNYGMIAYLLLDETLISDETTNLISIDKDQQTKSGNICM